LSAAFLGIATRAWPERLAELGLMDVAARRVGLMRWLADSWREDPPRGVVVAAGSTGSAPVAADLLRAIAAAPQGAVVLPGLDVDLAETAWKDVGDQHPQGALRRLLDRAGVDRAEVRAWDPAVATEAAGRWRRRLINEALRPPDATADWLKQIDALRAEAPAGVDPIAEGLAGLTLLTARAEEEAATLAALLLRETLEDETATAALITPDEALARRVSARLTRWGVMADSSAGQPLSGTPIAVLSQLLAASLADPLDPVRLLAILKHPMTRLGLNSGALEAARDALEARALRGPRARSWELLEARLAAPPIAAGALGLLASLRAVLASLDLPFADGDAQVGAAARALAEAIEAIASGPDPADPWNGPAGEAMARVILGLIDEAQALPRVTRRGFGDLIAELAGRETVRPSGTGHPRLRILGVLEARMVRADRLILAGLEEGVWPQAAPVDPFLSRPMRAALGLTPPERRIGLSAHDFAQAACAPNVYLIQSERRDGAPAVASRWLWRLRTLAKGAGSSVPGRPDLIAWARALEAPVLPPPPSLRPATRPAPTPPLAARPRRMAVTTVETWLRDPYAVYASRILGLRPMERPDEPVDARARGTAIHAAFERLARDYPTALPDAPEALFTAMLLHELEKAGMPAPQMAREAALAAKVAAWVAAFETERRAGARLVIEAWGELAFAAPGGEFKLSAKADRIEARAATADVLDFKTGTPPSPNQVRSGLSPQLTLTAAILAAGGFADIGPKAPGELAYVRVTGRTPPGEVIENGKGDSAALAEDALAGLKRRVALFDNSATPYRSWDRPQFIGRRGGDYDQLARLWEWWVTGEADVGEGGE